MKPLEPIGVIKSPHTRIENMPIQPRGAADIAGTVVLDPTYTEGLADLEGFSHIYLIYIFHRAERIAMKVVPFMDECERGIFATRSPLRPNPIGLSIVELVGIDQNILKIRGVDMLDGTPLLDIKPYCESFDAVAESRSGWLKADDAAVRLKRSDDRFG